MDRILIILKKKKDPRAIFNNIQTYSRSQVTIGPLVLTKFSIFMTEKNLCILHWQVFVIVPSLSLIWVAGWWG